LANHKRPCIAVALPFSGDEAKIGGSAIPLYSCSNQGPQHAQPNAADRDGRTSGPPSGWPVTNRGNWRPQRTPSDRGGAPRGHLTSSPHEWGNTAQGWSNGRSLLIVDGRYHCICGQIRGPSTPNRMQRTATAAQAGRPVAALSRTVDTGWCETVVARPST